jgi:hypothetical protein
VCRPPPRSDATWSQRRQLLDTALSPGVHSSKTVADVTSKASNHGGEPSKLHRKEIAGTRRRIEFRLIRPWAAPALERAAPPRIPIGDDRSKGLDGFRLVLQNSGPQRP